MLGLAVDVDNKTISFFVNGEALGVAFTDISLPAGWMKTVLKTVKTTFGSSDLTHSKAKTQWAHVRPGASWSAPEAMSNFLREIYILSGGTINLPYHGAGSTIGILEGNIAEGLIPNKEAVYA